MKDTITAKISVEADYPTLQAMRKALGDEMIVRQFQDFMQRAVTKGLKHVIEEPVTLEVDLDTPSYHTVRKGKRDPIPKVEKGILSWYDPYADLTNEVGKVGSKEWYEWLADRHNKSFRYISKDEATFTAIKNKQGLWRAHKRLGPDNKLRRKYLGKPANLTKKKLDAVAFELAQRPLA